MENPVKIDSGVVVTDGDNTTLASAMVSIEGNFQSLEDILAFTNEGLTMGIYLPATILTLDTDYTVSGSTVTILKNYLAISTTGTVELTFNFSTGNPQKLTISVSDSTSPGSGNSSSSSSSSTITTPSMGAPVIVNGETHT